MAQVLPYARAKTTWALSLHTSTVAWRVLATVTVPEKDDPSLSLTRALVIGPGSCQTTATSWPSSAASRSERPVAVRRVVFVQVAAAAGAAVTRRPATAIASMDMIDPRDLDPR